MPSNIGQGPSSWREWYNIRITLPNKSIYKTLLHLFSTDRDQRFEKAITCISPSLVLILFYFTLYFSFNTSTFSMTYKPVVAVFGTNGFLGKPVLDALTGQFKNIFTLPIRALTRDESKSKSESKNDTEVLKYYSINAEDDTATKKLYDDALEGVDVVINLTGSNAALDPILQALKRKSQENDDDNNSNIKLYIPSQFGTDVQATSHDFPSLFNLKIEHSQKSRQVKGLKVVDIYTSYFFVPGGLLYEVVQGAGYNSETKKVTFIGNENTKFSVSGLEDVGRTIAVVASMDPNASIEIPDHIRVYSDMTSQREIIETFEKIHDTRLRKNPNLPLDKAVMIAQGKLTEGFKYSDFFYYMQTIAAQGEGKGLAFEQNNHRELINPGEKLWKWQQYP